MNMLNAHKLSKKINLIILFLICISSAYVVYTLQSNYAYLRHVDEWQHFAYANELVKSGQPLPILHINPYFKDYVHATEIEFGYHYLLAELLILTRTDIITLGRIIPYLIYIFIILSAYTVVKKLTDSELNGILSAFFILFIKTDITLLGPVFAVPVAIGMAMSLFSIYFFENGLKQDNDLWMLLFCLIGVVTTFIHPPYGVILICFMVTYFLINLDQIKKIKEFIKKPIFLIIIIILMLTGLFILNISLFWEGTTIKTIQNLVSWLTHHVNDDPNNFVIYYGLPIYLGKIFTFFFIVGMFFSILKNELKAFLAWIIPLFLIIVAYAQEWGTYLIPYRRALLYFATIATVFASYGTIKVINLLEKKLNKTTSYFIVTIILLIGISMEFGNVLQKPAYTYQFIGKNDYDAMLWIKNNLKNNETVLAKLTISTALTPITDLKVCGIVNAQLWNYDEELRLRVERVELEPCEEIQKTANMCKADYVYLNYEISCENFNPIYKNNGVWIYRLSRNTD